MTRSVGGLAVRAKHPDLQESGSPEIVLPFWRAQAHSRAMEAAVRIHGNCVARDGAGVLIVGPPGAGKSDLTLRLLDRGFQLVADDQVEIKDGRASAPASLAGLLEVRGLGIVRLPFVSETHLKVVISLTGTMDRLPPPDRHPGLDLPVVRVIATQASAPDRVALALDCALGLVAQHTGAFTA